MNVNIEQIEGNFYWAIIINNNSSGWSSSIRGSSNAKLADWCQKDKYKNHHNPRRLAALAACARWNL